MTKICFLILTSFLVIATPARAEVPFGEDLSRWLEFQPEKETDEISVSIVFGDADRMDRYEFLPIIYGFLRRLEYEGGEVQLESIRPNGKVAIHVRMTKRQLGLLKKMKERIEIVQSVSSLGNSWVTAQRIDHIRTPFFLDLDPTDKAISQTYSLVLELINQEFELFQYPESFRNALAAALVGNRGSDLDAFGILLAVLENRGLEMLPPLSAHFERFFYLPGDTVATPADHFVLRAYRKKMYQWKWVYLKLPRKADALTYVVAMSDKLRGTEQPFDYERISSTSDWEPEFNLILPPGVEQEKESPDFPE